MSYRGPIVTLVAVLGLALVLLVVNQSASGRDTVGAAPAAQTGPAATGAPSPSASTAAPAASEPPSSPFPAKARYIGEATTKNGPIPLAITVDGDRAKAYLCDGRKIEAWLQGTARDGRLELTGRGSNRLTGGLSGGTVTGKVLVAGYPEWTFTARPATGAHAGIYRASAGGTTTGWVVADDAGRRQVGISKGADGQVVPAPQVDVTALTAPVPGQPSLVDGDTNVLPGS